MCIRDSSDTVGYIKLKQITQNAADLVKNAVADLESQGATSFVLDIRDNQMCIRDRCGGGHETSHEPALAFAFEVAVPDDRERKRSDEVHEQVSHGIAQPDVQISADA